MKRVSRKYVGKCFKNGAEIAPDRLPGTSWHSFWASWALLRLISGLLGPPGGHFGSPGSHFGPLLALLGLSWRSWALRGSQNGSKMAPKMAPKWLPGGLPEGSRHWGTLFCENPTGMHTGAEFSKPGYHGTGSARGERASSTASDARAAREARGMRARAPAPRGAATQERQEQSEHEHSKRT